MHVHLAVEVLLDAEFLGAGADEAHRRLRRFLHHVAQRTGQSHLPVPLTKANFNRQDIAAKLTHRQTRGYANLVRLFRVAVRELLWA